MSSSFSKSTIQRCAHDKENPYAQISRDLIRDKSISPNCRMILIFLLSNDDRSWIIKPSQIYEHFKKFIGRDVVYKHLDEAIEAGYIKREEYLEGNFKRYRYFLSEKPKFKKCFLYPDSQYTGSQFTENQGSKERTCKHKKENIIAEPPLSSEKPILKPKIATKPAGGNNNFYKSLDKCFDLSDRQKSLLMKYPENLVDQAVRYCYHPTTKINGGPTGRIKLLLYFLKNFDQFKKTLEELDNPPIRESKKDMILGRFKRGETYNGYEFLQDDIGVGFIKSGMHQPYSVRWDALNFSNDFLELLKKCRIEFT